MRPREEDSTIQLLDALKWQDVTVELADQAGRMASRYLRSHPGIDTVDYLVAAATRLLDGVLYTVNTKHFPMFKDLKPAYRYLK
jgi:predicted nucleic acid-binding protein